MLLIGREREKGLIGKIPGPSRSRSGKSRKNRESTKKDTKGRTSPDRETPPFETPPFCGPGILDTTVTATSKIYLKGPLGHERSTPYNLRLRARLFLPFAPHRRSALRRGRSRSSQGGPEMPKPHQRFQVIAAPSNRRAPAKSQPKVKRIGRN